MAVLITQGQSTYTHLCLQEDSHDTVQLGSDAEIRWVSHLLQLSEEWLKQAVTSKVTVSCLVFAYTLFLVKLWSLFRLSFCSLPGWELCDCRHSVHCQAMICVSVFILSNAWLLSLFLHSVHCLVVICVSSFCSLVSFDLSLLVGFDLYVYLHSVQW